MKIYQSIIISLIGILLFSCKGEDAESQTPQSAQAPMHMDVPKDSLPSHIIKPESPILYVKESKLVLVDGSEIEIAAVGDTTVAIGFFVNHGEKEPEESEKDGLTVRGRLHASRLANVLKDSGLKALYWTSNAEMQTGSFTATSVECRSLMYPAETSHLLMEHLVDNESGNRILIIGHQFSIPEMLNRLTKKNYFKFVPETNFDKFYVAVIKDKKDITVYDLNLYTI